MLRIPMGLGAANKKDALAFMKKAVELNPEYINHRLEMGITYLKYKDREAAGREFEKCLELPSQRPLDEKYKEEAQKYLAQGQFPPGSMGPKIEAAIDYIEGGGREVLITSASQLKAALIDRSGTRITANNEE